MTAPCRDCPSCVGASRRRLASLPDPCLSSDAGSARHARRCRSGLPWKSRSIRYEGLCPQLSMTSKRRENHKPDEIVAKPRHANAILSAGKDLATVLQAFEISEAGSPRASIPHALAGKASTVQCQSRPRAAASGFWLPPIGPIKDSHLLSFIHAQRTAAAFQAFTRSMLTSLRHPWLRSSTTPAPGHGQPLAASSLSCDSEQGSRRIGGTRRSR